MQHVLAIAASHIGQYLSFEERNTCRLAHKYLSGVHDAFRFHEWNICVCDGTSNGFDPAVKMNELLRLKPRLLNLTINLRTAISNDNLHTILSWTNINEHFKIYNIESILQIAQIQKSDISKHTITVIGTGIEFVNACMTIKHSINIIVYFTTDFDIILQGFTDEHCIQELSIYEYAPNNQTATSYLPLQNIPVIQSNLKVVDNSLPHMGIHGIPLITTYLDDSTIISGSNNLFAYEHFCNLMVCK